MKNFRLIHHLFAVIVVVLLLIFFIDEPTLGDTAQSSVIVTNPQCSDSVDNDGDSFIDFPSDPGCDSTLDNNETDPPSFECSDSIDNDGDSLIDFPNDPGCTSTTDDNETDPVSSQCDDGVDNDGDGLIDFPSDPGCTSSGDNDETDPDDGGSSGILFIDSQPPVISNLFIDSTTSTASITWNAIDPNNPVICTFDYGLTASYGMTSNVQGSYDVALLNLVPETKYFFRITCQDSSLLKNTTFLTGSFITSPLLILSDGPVITNLQISPNETTANLNWDVVITQSLVNCNITYDTDPTLLNGITTILFDDSSQNFFVNLQNLSPDTTYYFRLTCTDVLSQKDTVDDLFFTLQDSIPPPDIIFLDATPGEKQITLDWDYTTSLSDFSHYLIRRSTSSFPISIHDGDSLITLNNISIHTFLDDSVNPLVTYYYTLFVFDTSQNNSNGVSASATPFGPLTKIQFRVSAQPEKRAPQQIFEIVEDEGNNLALDIFLSAFNPALGQSLATVQFSIDNSGIGTSKLVEVPVGIYKIFLKGQSHLAKSIPNIQITEEDNIIDLDFTFGDTFKLIAGDVQGTGMKDNIINSLDISATLIDLYSSGQDADLNRDGQVNSLDLSILLINLYKTGDQML